VKLIFFFYDAEIKDKLLSNKDCFVWEIEVPLPGKFIIDIEFLDLKTTCTNVSI
jgi:speckle-type POZ protein